MVTAAELQTPQIVDVSNGTIRIKHPDITIYSKTTLRATIAAAATSMTVADNDGFEDNDFMVVGKLGDSKAEEVDVNGVVTRGSALTVTNSLSFGHELDEPVTKIYERQFTIHGSATDGGSLTDIIASASARNIEWDKPYSEYTLKTADTTFAFYVVRFFDGTTASSDSDYVPAAGNPSNSVVKVAEKALELTGARVYEDVTWEFLIEAANDAQTEISQFVLPDNRGGFYKKNWAFEIVGDEVSANFIQGLEMEDKYALSGLSTEMKYGDTNQSVLSVAVGNQAPLKYQSIQDHERERQGVRRTELAAATVVGATSLTVVDASYLSDDGTVRIGGDSITYTTKVDSTGVLSGIPASGTGSITAIFAVGRAVFQGISGGLPDRYTVFNGDLYLNRPLDSTYAPYQLKFKYLRSMTALTELSDTTLINFENAFQFYIAYKIELRRQNLEKAAQYKTQFEAVVRANAEAEATPSMDGYQHWSFVDGTIRQETFILADKTF